MRRKYGEYQRKFLTLNIYSVITPDTHISVYRATPETHAILKYLNIKFLLAAIMVFIQKYKRKPG